MTTIPSLPSFEEISKTLEKTSIDYSPAQVHGLMCGVICATGGKTDSRWEKILFKSKKPQHTELLFELYENSYHQLSEFSFEFTLLLPNDQVDLSERTESLGLWCQGFLTGLEHCNIPINNRPPSEITETLNDIFEISQVNYVEISSDEDDETAYYELLEYVRLAVLMIFHELKNEPVSKNNHSSDLH